MNQGSHGLGKSGKMRETVFTRPEKVMEFIYLFFKVMKLFNNIFFFPSYVKL